MKQQLTSCLALAALILAGCDSRSPHGALPDSAGETVALFRAGKGVLDSAETRALLGVQTVDAAERPMRRLLTKSAEVYRPASATAPGAATFLCSPDEAAELSPGRAVTLRPTSGQGPEIAGRVRRLDPQAQAALGQIEVLIEFADSSGQLVAGALVHVHFSGEDSKPALAVPASAVLEAAEGYFVYAVNGTHLTRTRVKPGIRHDDFIAIEDGLYAGDAVAARGVENLWLVELSALNGGTPCCFVPKKPAAR